MSSLQRLDLEITLKRLLPLAFHTIHCVRISAGGGAAAAPCRRSRYKASGAGPMICSKPMSKIGQLE